MRKKKRGWDGKYGRKNETVGEEGGERGVRRKKGRRRDEGVERKIQKRR